MLSCPETAFEAQARQTTHLRVIAVLQHVKVCVPLRCSARMLLQVVRLTANLRVCEPAVRSFEKY